jgi:hypothetical protein
MLIRMSAIGSELPIQKCNSSNKIIVEGILIKYILLCLILIEVEFLTEICISSNNSNKDSDNSEFLPIYKIKLKKKQQATQDLGIEHILKAVDKLVLDKGGYFIASRKSILRLDLRNSQGMYSKCPLL